MGFGEVSVKLVISQARIELIPVSVRQSIF